VRSTTRRTRFNLNQAALAAAEVALSEVVWRDYGATLVCSEREKLEATLRGLGIEHFPSDANFVTMRVPWREALHDALVRHDLGVRAGVPARSRRW
jgi:histidinol-phosphate aminotransferase